MLERYQQVKCILGTDVKYTDTMGKHIRKKEMMIFMSTQGEAVSDQMHKSKDR